MPNTKSRRRHAKAAPAAEPSSSRTRPKRLVFTGFATPTDTTPAFAGLRFRRFGTKAAWVESLLPAEALRRLH